MGFSDFSTKPSYSYDATSIYNIVKASEFTLEQFDEFCRSHPDYSVCDGGDFDETALSAAAMSGNIALIDHIVAKGGKELLFHANSRGITPLHKAIMSIYFVNQEKGTLATKKLLQLGTPVNLVTKFRNNDGSFSYSDTPLATALEFGEIEAAKMLLRRGGKVENVNKLTDILSKTGIIAKDTLKTAEKEVKAEIERFMLSKLVFNQFENNALNKFIDENFKKVHNEL